MIQVFGLSKSYGERVLFSDVTFSINKGERVGLVGRNGSGKSTLFKILLGELSFDAGDMNIPKAYKLGTLKQHIEFTHDTVISECMSALSKEFEYETYRAEKLLFGLGFTQKDMERSPGDFSGGYQIRINLVKTLLQEPDCLLLDEPTNYLDIVSLRWLRDFLKSFAGEVVLITHDKDFMNSVVTHTMGISRKNVRKFKGDTNKFYERIIEEEEIYEQTRINQEKKIQHMMDYVDKFRAKARGASQAQSKLKMIEKMERYDALANEKNLDFAFNYQQCPAKVIVRIDGLTFGYNESNLFENISFVVESTDRIGIIGKNGKGKSTFLNCLGDFLTPRSGEVWKHSSLSLGHFGQTNVDRLYAENTIYQEVQSENEDMTIAKARSVCGTMLFSGDDADKKIKVLSGGERARVLLGKILARRTNLLFLDEPTNHLDMESVESLIDAIKDYEGACLVVTHSEELLRKCVNKLVVFREDHAEVFEGTYDEFLEKIGWDSEEEKVVSQKPVEIIAPVKKKKGNTQKLEVEEEEVTSKIEVLENYVNVLNDGLVKASQDGDHAKIVSASKEIEEVNQKIEELFLRLEEIHDLLAD